MKLAIGLGIFLFVICAVGPLLSVIVSGHVAQRKNKEKGNLDGRTDCSV